MKLRGAVALLLAVIAGGTALPTAALDATELALVVNLDDPVSVASGVYYSERRRLPVANVIKIHLGVPREVLSPEAFAQVYATVQAHTPPTVQGYALAWTLPYRVGCMSITSAFAFGYSTRFCAEGCKSTAPNPYFDTPSRRPYADFRLRPAMLLAARTFENAEQLIDRGIRSDGLNPRGTAYLVVTKDQARGTRAPAFQAAKLHHGTRLPVELLATNMLRDRFDVMFYFTGAVEVLGLKTLGFLPGAVADHLTSAGGALNGTHQMSALRWLEAGATGSFGAVVEPCNFPQKFPDPDVLMKHYLAGETLLEAYWKSVVWPGQGVFIGEPLAAPFRAPKPAAPE